MTRSTRTRKSAPIKKSPAPPNPSGPWTYLIAAAGLGALAITLLLLRSGNPGGGSGAPIVDVTVPALTTAERAGESAFNARCASCHGDDAAGREGTAPPLVHRIYEPGHHGDHVFLLAAQIGVRSHHWSFGDMPPVKGIAPDEVASVVAYIRALQRANGIE